MSAPAPTLYPGTRLRQLYDVALASPPATTALPLLYDPPAGRWKAQQIGTAGIADGAITFPKLAADVGTGFDGRWVNVTGDTMTGGLAINLTTGAAGLTLRGGAASDNTQLRFIGNASAVAQWAIGNEIVTGGTGRNFDIYDMVLGANRLRIDSAGNVMIGTTSPLGELTVKGAASSNADLSLIEGDTSNGWLLGAITSDDSFQITRFVAPSTYTNRLTITPGGTLIPAGNISMPAATKIDFADEVKDDKIDLFAGSYLIGIRGGTQAYFVPASSVHAFFTSNVSRLSVSDTAVTSTVPVVSGSKANHFGTASGTGYTLAQATTDANILLYNFSASNWAGIGTDGGGNMWFGTRTSGAPIPTLALTPGGDVIVQRGTFQQAGGYAYLGNINAGGVYPRAGNDLAVAWNFTNGTRDISLWNTDTLNTAVNNNPSFVFRQLNPGNTQRELLRIKAAGEVWIPYGGATPLNILTFGDVTAFAIGAGGQIRTNQVTGAGVNAYNVAPSASARRVAICDAAGTLLGYCPIYP